MKCKVKIQKILSILLVVVLAFSVVPLGTVTVNAAGTVFAGGTGTESDPYLIATKEHLNNVRNYENRYYKMIADIEFTEADFAEGGEFYNDGEGWLPIGSNSYYGFKCYFDGDNHSISGLTIDAVIDEVDFRKNNLHFGLFGYNKGTIQNVTVKESDITVTVGEHECDSDWIFTGAVAGQGELVNCHYAGNVNVVSDNENEECRMYTGGLIGTGTAVNCSNSGRIISEAKDSPSSWLATGGIAGYSSRMTGCYNTGDIKSEGNFYGDTYAGGISGAISFDSSIKQCYNLGMVTTSSSGGAGGILGYADGRVTITNCFNAGMIDGGSCGGIVGDILISAEIENCYNAGVVAGYEKWAISGDTLKPADLKNCYCLEDVARPDKNVILCTKQEMSARETFAGFDFDYIWTMEGNSEYPWPELQGMPAVNGKKTITECEITFDKMQVQYHTPQPTVTVTDHGKKLELNKDYTAKYIVGDEVWMAEEGRKRNVGGIGTAKVLVTGIGDYYDVAVKEFEVVKFDLANASLWTPWIHTGNGNISSSFDLEDFDYDGSPKTQSGFRVCDYDNTVAEENYEVTYKDNVNAGVATMLITGKGDYYTGKLERSFVIRSKEMSDFTVSLSTTHYTFDGSVKKPSVTVKGKDGKVLKPSDYVVKYASGREAIGRYAVTVTLRGNYRGSRTTYFEIGPKNPTAVTTSLYGYDDAKISWSRVSGASGYKVYYRKSTSKNYALLTTTTSTSCTKPNMADGGKYYFKVVAYKTINGNRCENGGKTSTIYALKKLYTPIISGYGSKVKVRWSNIAGETGYQISRSTSKTGTYIAAAYKTTTGTTGYVSAAKGKYYYYKVRAYRQVGSKKIYAPWSTAVRFRR